MEDMAFENGGSVQVSVGSDATKAEGPAKPAMAQIVITGCLAVLQGLIPIYYMTVHSLNRNEKQKAYFKERGLPPEKMSYNAAVMIPLAASFGLLVYYTMLTQEIMARENMELVLIVCLDLLAVLSLIKLGPKLGNGIPVSTFDLVYYIVLDLFMCSILGMGHKFAKMSTQDFRSLCILPGWIPVSFVLIFIHLNNVITGFILSAGMFIYSVFWTLFGANILSTVARSITVSTMAPILSYPHDLFETELSVEYLPAIGSLDIILPGLFISLMFRFDNHMKASFPKYFNFSLFSYMLGYAIAGFVKINFGYAPPVLMYLLPACVGIPMLVALISGDFKALLQYEDYPRTVDKKLFKDDQSSRKSRKKIK